jgi:hypothetical protein
MLRITTSCSYQPHLSSNLSSAQRLHARRPDGPAGHGPAAPSGPAARLDGREAPRVRGSVAAPAAVLSLLSFTPILPPPSGSHS